MMAYVNPSHMAQVITSSHTKATRAHLAGQVLAVSLGSSLLACGVKRVHHLECQTADTDQMGLHKLCEVIHGGNQPLPLPRFIGRRWVLRHMGRGLGRGRRMYLQREAGCLVLCFFA